MVNFSSNRKPIFRMVTIFGLITLLILFIYQYKSTDYLTNNSIRSNPVTKKKYPENNTLDSINTPLIRNKNPPTINVLAYKKVDFSKNFHDMFKSAIDAIDYIEEKIINGDTSQKILSIYIITCLMSGNIDTGIQFLKKYMHLNPVEFSIGLGMLYFQKSDIKSSRRYYEKSVLNNMEYDIRPVESLANFETSQGNTKKAISLYESFLSDENIDSNGVLSQKVIDNNRLQAQSELIQIFINIGNYEKANNILYKLYSEGVDTVHLQHYYNQINHLDDPPDFYEDIDK